MKWQEIRELVPHRWVVVEAIDAFTEGSRRIVDELVLIRAFGEDSHEAWSFYKRIHAQDRWREYYYLHTDREELDIEAMDSFRRTVSE